MLKQIWSATKYYFFLAIGLVLLYVVFKDVDFKWMWNEIRHAHFGWIALSFVLGLLAMASRAWRWRIMLEPLGYKASFRNTFSGVAIGYLSNIAFPRMGEVVRCTILTQTDGIPVTKLIGTVILERVIDVVMLLSLITIVFFTQIDRFGRFFMNEVFGDKLHTLMDFLSTKGWIVIPTLLLLLVAGFFLLRWIINRFGDNKIIRKLVEFGNGISDGLITLFKMEKKGWFLFHTLAIWTLYFMMTWICVYAYDPTSFLSPFDGLFLMVVGGLGMTAPVQGGFGAFHYLVEKALFLYDIKPSINAITGAELRPGLVFATIVHTTQFIMTLFAGVFGLLSVALQRKKQDAQKSH
jgi:uncharacterized protein (TIRG00374 family)